MVHYTIDYAGMSPQDAHTKAIQDIKDYMGEERYTIMTKRLRLESPPGVGAFMHIYAPFAGVQGYPARAWYDEIWPYG